jgi:cytochrome c5
MQRGRTTIGAFWIAVSIVLVWTSAFHQAIGATAARQGAPQADRQELIAKGRQAVAQTCVPCHVGIVQILQLHKKSANEWRNTVYSMIGRGAHILPEEIEPLTAFLAATAGVERQSAPAAGPAGSQTGAAAAPVSPLAAQARSILDRHCRRCHDLELATRKPASGDWNTVITRMVGYGADISSAEQLELVAYLNVAPKQP